MPLPLRAKVLLVGSAFNTFDRARFWELYSSKVSTKPFRASSTMGFFSSMPTAMRSPRAGLTSWVGKIPKATVVFPAEGRYILYSRRAAFLCVNVLDAVTGVIPMQPLLLPKSGIKTQAACFPEMLAL